MLGVTCQVAEEKDAKALLALEMLDEHQFFTAIETHHITACGYGPIVALISSVKQLGCERGRLLCYKTSGDIAGEYSAVVGYASMAFNKSRKD